MSEGYQRRPEEEISREEWRKTLKTAGVCLLIAIGMGFMLSLVCEAVRQRDEMQTVVDALRTENAALTKQLDFLTCRVQFDPMPVPEQTNESSTPTLLPLEDR